MALYSVVAPKNSKGNGLMDILLRTKVTLANYLEEWSTFLVVKPCAVAALK